MPSSEGGRLPSRWQLIVRSECGKPKSKSKTFLLLEYVVTESPTYPSWEKDGTHMKDNCAKSIDSEVLVTRYTCFTQRKYFITFLKSDVNINSKPTVGTCHTLKGTPRRSLWDHCDSMWGSFRFNALLMGSVAMDGWWWMIMVAKNNGSKIVYVMVSPTSVKNQTCRSTCEMFPKFFSTIIERQQPKHRGCDSTQPWAAKVRRVRSSWSSELLKKELMK